MAPKFDLLQDFIKTAVVGGICIVWLNFTIKSFKMAWQIMFNSSEDTFKHVPVVVCEECVESFFDDGNELKNGRLLCDTCSDYESEKKLFQQCLTKSS